MTLCDCGCGGITFKKFIRGHNTRLRKHSEETKKKISLALKGHLVSPEVIEKIRAKKKGKKYPLVHIFKKGCNHWVGRKHSEESKAKMSIAAQKRRGRQTSEETKAKISMANKGQKRTEQQKREMSLNYIGRFAKEKHPSWKGGVSPLQNQIRRTMKYKEWTTSVFRKDGFVCNLCGRLGGKLTAHHEKPFARILGDNNVLSIDDAFDCRDLWNVQNGKTLCFDCHKKTHSLKRNGGLSANV